MSANRQKERKKPGYTVGINIPEKAEYDWITANADKYRKSRSDLCRIAVSLGIRQINANPALMWEAQFGEES